MQNKIYNFANKRIERMYYTIDDSVAKENKSPSLIVFLHGAGERGEDHELLFVHGPAKYVRAGRITPSYILLCPQCPEGLVWNNLTVELKELIDSVVKEYSVDPEHISITGISMGGFGTWEMGMSYPGFFRKLGPVCGGGISWRARNIGKTPVWAIHGDADDVVPVRNSIEMCEKLSAAGGNVELTLLHGVGHNSWEFTYERTTLLNWLVD